VSRVKTRTKRKISHLTLPLQRQFSFGSEGRYFDLQTVFDKMNARYFRNRLKDYTITWGRRRREKPKSYFVFGTIQEADRIIRIHPLLDRNWVPTWFLEFVVYHEMLHAVVPDKFDAEGRRIIHHADFLKKERRFYWFKRATKWESENLGRLLR
jgi:hypothetical protein